MAEQLTLLEFVSELLSSEHLRDQFASDPQSALDDHGLGHLTTADVDDALVLVQDTQTADFQREYAAGHDLGEYAGGSLRFAADDTGSHGVGFYEDFGGHAFDQGDAAGFGSGSTAAESLTTGDDVLFDSGPATGFDDVWADGSVHDADTGPSDFSDPDGGDPVHPVPVHDLDQHI